MGQDYSDWINTEFTRLKDFLAGLKSVMSALYSRKAVN